ncbi:MAG: DMT family transporter [Clostridiaceae bacterium]|nr:DMT family transporter [Clostridiaceae bacterium]
MFHKYKGYIVTILSACLFGLSPLWVNIFSSGGGNSMLLTFFRNLLFLPFCAIALKKSGQPVFQKVTRQMSRKITILSVIGAGLTQILLFSSYRYMASGICTTVHFIYPLFVFLMGAVFFGQRLTRRAVICLAICLSGLACFYPRGQQISLKGLIIALISGITYAFYMIYLDKGGFEGISTLRLQFYMSAINSIMMFIYCAATGNFTLNLSVPAWVLGFAASQILGIAVILCQIGVKEIGAPKAALLSTFEPITSLIVGILFLHERLDAIAAIGALIILFSVFLFNMPQKTAPALIHHD